MPNDPIGATGEAVSTTLHASSTIDDLLAAYIAERRLGDRIYAKIQAADAALPAWARPGPKFIYHDGSKGGGDVGWPEVAVVPPPSDHPAVMRSIRPSPSEVWKRANLALDMPQRDGHDYIQSDGSVTHRPLSEKERERRRQLRLAGFARVRLVIARVREQRAEKAKVNLPELNAEYDASYDRRWALHDAMEKKASGNAASDIAALALLEWAGDEENSFALDLMRRLAPQLCGLLRIVVDDAVAHGEDGIGATLIMGVGDSEPVDLLARRAIEQVAA